MTDQKPTINNPGADALMQNLLIEAHEKLKIATFYMGLKGWNKTHEALYKEISEIQIAVTVAGMALDDTAK